MSGRGRGRSLFTFNVDSLGFGRGDALPSSAQAPSPLYPPMQFRPVPLQTGEEVDYMLALKQEFRASSKNLPFHIQPSAAKKDVTRYSDKYQTREATHREWTPEKRYQVWLKHLSVSAGLNKQPLGSAVRNNNSSKMTPTLINCYNRDGSNDDWSRLPKELCIKDRKSRKAKTKPVVKSKIKPAAPKDLLQKLENLEKNEEENQSEDEEEDDQGKKKKKSGEEEEEPNDAEEYDEEEFEEETDYIVSYFDNGEGFGGDSDDNIDEATY